jgi:general nucleoside transport system permease protein
MSENRSPRVNEVDASDGGAMATATRHALEALGAADWLRAVVLASAAVALALGVTAVLIAISGKNPVVAYTALVRGAVGSIDRIAFALNKSTPYILGGVGVALCFRARVINIGAEGQIAVGGIAATWVALNIAASLGVIVIPAAIAAAALGGAGWAAFAAAIRLTRGVHEVLCTLLLNFVGLLLVSEALHGPMGEPGAGFPQSPLFTRAAWLPNLVAGTDLHIGILIAVFAVVACHLLLWRTTFGFRLRVLGASPAAAAYAGVSFPRCAFAVMALAGGLAGIAGGIEVLGVHYRLIEGFSLGFGFNAVAVALLASINPIAVLPAGLFLGFLEAGALAMQREVGVPSSLVFVIEGMTMVFVLCAIGIGIRQQRV